jgi:hypothetical protein
MTLIHFHQLNNEIFYLILLIFYLILLKNRNLRMCDILNLFNKTNLNINDYIVSKILSE